MSKEIERKFIVKTRVFLHAVSGVHYRQGYIPTRNGSTVRIRIAGEKAYATFKDKAVGFTRNEFEYEIPVGDAQQMLDLLCETPQIEKIRYRIAAAEPGLTWEVDEFLGANSGLVLAEMEVPSEDTAFTLPEWIGAEVTGQHGYNNAALCRHPYTTWTDDEKQNGPRG